MNALVKMYISLQESLGIYTADQLYELFTDRHHGLPISRHRAAIMQSRVYFFSVIFALLVPAWSVVDWLFLPDGLWMELLAIRLLLESLAGYGPAFRRFAKQRQFQRWVGDLASSGRGEILMPLAGD